jgi:LPXTG-site transpeptidase (sortase) family protein
VLSLGGSARRISVASAAFRLVVSVLTLSLGLVATTVRIADAAPSIVTSRFVPQAPTRLFDSRATGQRVQKGKTIVFTLDGELAPGATAAVLNLTAVHPDGPGFLTAFPADRERPQSSNLNVSQADQTVANLATVPVDSAGRFAVYTSGTTDLVVDLFGVYQATSSAGSGRLVVLPPTRAFDTRTQRTPLAAKETRRVDLSSTVPASASSVVLNLTVATTPSPGFFTVWAAGSSQPNTSNLNVANAGDTVANQVIVPLRDGAINVFSQSGGDVIVDVNGYYTGESAPESSDGLFVAVSPTRLLDTRAPGLLNPVEDRLKPRKDWTIEVPVLYTGGIATRAAAIVMTTTVVDAEGPGFVSVWAAGSAQPSASTVNASYRRQTIANHVITPVSYRGASLYTSVPMHLLADVSGWFTGTPAPIVVKPVDNVLPSVHGRLVVPAIGIDTPLGDGLEDETLDISPMHWSLSSMPGELGTMNILGHRTSHGGPFLRIGELRVGDAIYVTNGGITWGYRVTGSQVVSPQEVLGLVDNGTPNLNLVACHPIGSTEQRLVVHAELTDVVR